MTWCRHRWVDADRRFVPPVSRHVKVRNDERLANQVAFGFTVVEQRCEKCGKVRAVELFGDAR